MKKTIIYISSLFLLNSCNNIQTQGTENDLSKLVFVKDYNSIKQGYGNNVVAEIENNSDKKVTFVSVEFTWKDITVI